jgi:hypothetical protein
MKCTLLSEYIESRTWLAYDHIDCIFYVSQSFSVLHQVIHIGIHTIGCMVQITNMSVIELFLSNEQNQSSRCFSFLVRFLFSVRIQLIVHQR